MNYIYDIYLNFDKDYFDFYEWQNTDNILHIKKIPILKTTSTIFRKIISNCIKIDEKKFKTIKNKTEIYNSQHKINALIITDSKNVIAIKFNHQGISIARSSLILEDEYDILDFSIKNKENNLYFTILKHLNYICATRKERQEQAYLLKNINKLSYDTLKYLYYECFNKEENNLKIIRHNLISEITNNNYTICNHIYNILKPVSTN